MQDTIEAEELVRLVIHLANTKSIITFEDVNSTLFPSKWKEIEELMIIRDSRRRKLLGDSDCYCE